MSETTQNEQPKELNDDKEFDLILKHLDALDMPEHVIMLMSLYAAL